MSLLIASLNSGSNGNCYYVGNGTHAIFIDLGLSCRETEMRMKRLGLSMHQVKAIFISHEHTDHVKGIPSLAKKYDLPVYGSALTLPFCNLSNTTHKLRFYKPYQPVTVGDLNITAFPKFHDAYEPHSFVVTGNKVNIGIFTDIGFPCQQVIKHFSQCHAAFLESNYDEDLLEKGSYPYHLKKRIRGGKGHLSNAQALQIFRMHKPAFMSHLILSHLSQENNCPDLVRSMFTKEANGVHISVASRFKETPIYKIEGTAAGFTGKENAQPPRMVQASLF